MRTRKLSLFFLMSLLLLLSTSTYAQRRQGRRTNSQARQSTANRQAAAANVTGGDEQQAMARVRGYQLLMEREEKRLSQRMAHAAQLRQQGLQKEDENLLDQAEQYERKALAAYQGRIQQFEKTDLNSRVLGRAPKRGRDSKAFQGRQTTPKSQARSSQAKRKSARSRSPRSAKSAWSWLR